MSFYYINLSIPCSSLEQEVSHQNLHQPFNPLFALRARSISLESTSTFQSLVRPQSKKYLLRIYINLSIPCSPSEQELSPQNLHQPFNPLFALRARSIFSESTSIFQSLVRPQSNNYLLQIYINIPVKSQIYCLFSSRREQSNLRYTVCFTVEGNHQTSDILFVPQQKETIKS